ncbi:hypothetical protein ABS755_07215 [Castellaniella sp. FW104-16D08]|uniref:hypothetical protein n=1 Tax=unclassified Castellaniella TaxID=2617606 RepID=UPI00331486D9
MKVINTKLPKLCHARPGDVIRVTDDTGKPTDTLFLVAVFNAPGKRAMRDNMMQGLYDEERPLFMVNLETGEARPLPHLSSRIEFVRDIVAVEGCREACHV